MRQFCSPCSPARENARRSSCQSNLKQIGLGIFQYIQDYDEKYPVFNAGGVASGWAVITQPYLKSEQIFQCPSETNAPTVATGTDFTDYAYNLGLGFDPAATTPAARGLSQASLTQTTLTVLAIDANNGGADLWTMGCTNQFATASCPVGLAIFTGTNTAQRHLDGQNTLLADGHVKWYKGQSPTTSAKVYSYYTPGATAGQNPTFRYDP